ncbi:MAG: hypothetical protein MJB14_04280, partial [Spirochaetes bacterium]|nr:hypothetical protein [Spirochaetota bacterium]
MRKIINTFKEEIASTWTLLNDTTNFLMVLPIFAHHERTLKHWRDQLTQFSRNEEIYRQVKREIINLRKHLRLEGYDLRMGSKDIKFLGFKSDDAVIYGYKRMVLLIIDTNVYYLTGQENHLNLQSFLAHRYKITNISNYLDLHNLWYRWNHYILEICG